MLDLTKSAARIREKGGNHWAYVRTDVTGSVSGSDTWHDGIFREKSKFTFEKPEKKIFDEAGNQVASTYENVNTEIVITSLQDDADLELFLTQNTEDQYFGIIMAAGDNDDATNKVRYIPIARISTMYSVDAPGRRPEIRIVPQYNEYAKLPTGTMPSWLTISSGSLTCPAGKYYTVATQSGADIL